MMKKLTYAFFIVTLALSTFGADATGEAPKLRIVASIFPMYDLCRQVGGDAVQVTMLVPPGVEPHTYEPRPGDSAALAHADVFVYTGSRMEPWVQAILNGTHNPGLLVIDASTELAGVNGDRDPHLWLNLDYAGRMLMTIAERFAARDAARGVQYGARAAQYATTLASLDERFRTLVARSTHKTIVVGGHNVFGYFAARYGLTIVSPYRNYTPDAEPTPQNIMATIRTIREAKVRFILYEEMIDPKAARVIADETGATMLLLNGAHTVTPDDLARGVTLVDILEEDYRVLARALEVNAS